MNFEKYIGIPYAEKGRDETGIDCWGLVRLVYKNELNIDLPSFSSEYETSDNERLEELFAQYKEGWQPVDTPDVGDVVIFRIFGYESHIGICIGNNKFLHVREVRDSVVESLDNPKWYKRITGFYKYSEQKNAILNTVPHPLKTERHTLMIVPGTSVTELVKDISDKYEIAAELKSRISIMLNGKLVPQEKWSNTIIKQSDVIEYRAVPGKDELRLVAVLALSYYAPVLAGQLTGYTSAAAAAGMLGGQVTLGLTALNIAASAAIFLAGSSLLNAIAPIRPPLMGSRNDPGSSERQLMVNGGSNRMNPYGAIPVVLGKVRITPLLGSQNFLTYENERDSYLSMLLVWGYAPLGLNIGTYKIGNIPLLGNFSNVTFIDDVISTNLSINDQNKFNAIYGKDITQVNTAVELACSGPPETPGLIGPWYEAATVVQINPETSAIDQVQSVTVALHFPQGLRRIVTKGEQSGSTQTSPVDFRIEYNTTENPLGSDPTWQFLDSFTIGADSPKKDAFTFTKTYDITSDRLTIRVRRETGTFTNFTEGFQYYSQSILQNVTFLRNKKPTIDPVNAKIAKTAFKIKATDQLNGNIEGISAIVQTYCKIPSVSGLFGSSFTSNPAALMLYVLEHPANPRRITNAASQTNLSQLQYFYTYCQSKGFEYNGVLGESRGVLEVIRDICAAGRASPALIDGKWTVVIDEPKSTVVQHFTPHNSWNFEGTKALPKRPDALRVTYFDENTDYQESEIIVYDIGKNANTAVLFETITLPGVTKKSLVIDHARWHMAQMKLRPEVYTLESDLEYLVCNRGDRVKVMHDVPMWGLGSGRIKNRLSATQFELDEDVPMKAGVQYTMRVRSKTGLSTIRTVVAKPTDGNYSIIDFTASTLESEVDALDLFLFGELNQESQDLIVLSVEPTNNNNARLTLVDYGVTPEYNIFTDYVNLSASTVFESQITLPPTLQVQTFGEKVPLITGFVSDESVMDRVAKGVFKYNINVAYFNASQLPDIVESVEVQYDLSASETGVNFRSVFVPFQNSSANITDVKEGETYKIRMRYIGRNGITGVWTAYSNHTVVGKVNPPSSVTGFSIASDKASGKLLLSWNNNPEPDTSTYEVRTDNVGWGENDSGRVFYGDVNSVLVKPSFENDIITYFIKAVDSSDNYSIESTSFTYSRDIVPTVSDIRHNFSTDSLTSSVITLEWDTVENSEFNVDYYEISYDDVVIDSKSNSVVLPADWVGVKVFNIKTIDINSKSSNNFSKSIEKFRPGNVINLQAQVIDNNVMFYWTLPAKTSLPIDHVLLKRGLTWETAEIIGEKKGNFTTVNEILGGTYTYWLSCVDTSGIQSMTPVSVSSIVGEPPDFVFHGEFFSNFSQTKSSAVISNGSLILPVNTTETFEQHFTTRGWSGPSAQVSAGFPIFIQPTVNSSYYEEVFDFGQVLQSSKVSLTFNGITLAGNPVVNTKIALSLDNSTFVEYNGVRQTFGVNFRYVKITIEVSSNNPASLYEISNLNVKLDAKLINDAGHVDALLTDSLGTVVNFSKEFIDVQSITVSPSGTTAIIPVYDFKDIVASGTYSVTSNICTITSNNHGFITGQNIRLSIINNLGLSGVYQITSYTTNTFTVAMTTTNTTGDCSVYPESFRIYLFNTSGNRVSARASWSIKGY